MSIKHIREIPSGSPPPTGALNTGGVLKFRDFRPITRYISQTIQDSTIDTMERYSYAIYQMVLFPMTLNEP